jgi:ABC-type phosphate transport system substrate-binding protein
MRARLLLLIVLLAALLGAGSPPPPFVVIVNPDNPNTTLGRKFVADAFLKKTTRWPGGDVIHPVDLSPTSKTRERFTDAVLHRSVGAVKSYWQQIIFSGRDVPPPEIGSEEEVVKLVARSPGAIGYVSGTAPLAGVRIVRVE